MPSIDPKAAGCEVSFSDTGRVLTSCAIFMSFFNFGSCLAALGSALPQIAHDKGVSETSLGYVFIARGIGYLIGTLGSAVLIKIKLLDNSKMLLASLGILTSGVALALMSRVSAVWAMYLLIVFQGSGFGSIDALCNIVLAEVWGNRVQPWMQAAHAHFGLGGIFGPILVGYYKYKLAFALLGLTSCLTLLLTLFQIFIEKTMLSSQYTTLDDNNEKSEKKSNEPNQTGRNIENLDGKTADVEMSTFVHAGNNDNLYANEGKLFDANGSEESKVVRVLFPPTSLRLLLSSFFFIYVGIEIGYGGWISSYVILAELTESHAKAAYINAVFFMTLSLGRLVAIPLAIWVSNTLMLRFQLVFCLFSGLFIVAEGGTSYFNAVLGAGFLGFACSSIFPLVMTVVGDYGYTMDSKSTVSFILGSTVGEAVIPVCIGFIMAFVSPNAMNICVLVSAVVMIVIYLGSDRMMKSHFGDGDCDTADEVAVMKPVCNGFHDAIIEDDGCS